MARDDLVVVEGVLWHFTQKAVLISASGDKDDAEWVARSQISTKYGDDDLFVGRPLSIDIPEWVAQEKGFI